MSLTKKPEAPDHEFVDVAVGPEAQASTFGVTAVPARQLSPLRR